MEQLIKLNCKIKEPEKIIFRLKEYRMPEIESYEGNYFVIPKAIEQTVLQTKNKKMKDNVTIDKVPYYETSNNEGGTTAYIASEVR